MAEQVLETYHGNCHCGAFKFSVRLPELKEVFKCDCSICTKVVSTFLLLIFHEDIASRADWRPIIEGIPLGLSLVRWSVCSGEGRRYTEGLSFWKGDHGPQGAIEAFTICIWICVCSWDANEMKFCPTCGTAVMGQRHTEGPSIGVNVRRGIPVRQRCDLEIWQVRQVRTFRDFDEEKLAIKPYDGASLEPQYVPPNGPEVSDLNQSTKCYRGSCHCGNVSYDLQSKALEEIGVLSCNCSICSRVCLRSPTIIIKLWLMTATERRSLGLPRQKRRRAPRRKPSHRLPIRYQIKRARFLFDMWCPRCEPVQARIQQAGGWVYGGKTACQRAHHQWYRLENA